MLVTMSAVCGGEGGVSREQRSLEESAGQTFERQIGGAAEKGQRSASHRGGA